MKRKNSNELIFFVVKAIHKIKKKCKRARCERNVW